MSNIAGRDDGHSHSSMALLTTQNKLDKIDSLVAQLQKCTVLTFYLNLLSSKTMLRLIYLGLCVTASYCDNYINCHELSYNCYYYSRYAWRSAFVCSNHSLLK